MKEHSNFVASLINFRNGITRGTGTRTTAPIIKNERFFSERITTRVIENYEDSRITRMIENEEKMNERLDSLMNQLHKLSSERDALKAEVDAFRLIGYSNNPMFETTVHSINGETVVSETIPEVWLAEHKIGIASMSVETRLKNLKAYQKVIEIYIESVKLDSSKIQIKSDITERRIIEQKTAQAEIAETRESLKKKRFGPFYKSILGFMKTGITEAAAVKILLDMKVQVPDGYFELCGDTFKKELKSLLEKKGA